MLRQRLRSDPPLLHNPVLQTALSAQWTWVVTPAVLLLQAVAVAPAMKRKVGSQKLRPTSSAL
eukprot:954661-Rhodomonas_salina.1